MTSMIFQFFFGATFYHAINLARQTHNKPWIGMNEMFLIEGKKKKKGSLYVHMMRQVNLFL